jgi:undecaprenyl-diphosphatase
MLEYLINFAGHLGHWGYLVIFLVVVLECQALLGLVMPGESLVLAGGFFASQGLFDPLLLVIVISSAAIIGDSIGYELGRRLGRDWLLKHGKRFGLCQEYLNRVDLFFERHGGKAVFTGHFLHLLRSMMPFVAGDCRMRYQKFFVFNALGCIVWSSMFVSLGYLAGESWRVAANWVGVAGEIIGGTLLLAITLVWLWRLLRRHENNIKQRWRGISQHPHLVILRWRCAPHLEFLRNRLLRHNYPGLYLLTGVLLIFGASWLFGGIVQNVLAGDPLTIIDWKVAVWFHEHRTTGWTAAMQFVTGLASTTWVTAVATATMLVLLRKRCWYRSMTLVLVLPCGMVLDALHNTAFHRHLLAIEDSFLIFHGYSFPNGHTLAATLLYGLLAVFAVITVEARR